MKKSAPFFVCLAGILWGSMGIFVRRLNQLGLAAMDIVALRSFTTVLIMFAVLLIYDRKLFRIRIRDIWCFIGTGILSIVFFNYCYFKAITMISLSAAAILLYTAPAIVMLLSRVLFKEKFTKVKLISLSATFAGCVLVTGILGDSAALNGAGILAGLGAGLGYALYSIFSRYALERGYSSLTISFYTFLLAGISSIFLTDIRKIISVSFSSVGITAFSIAFGLVSTVLPYIIYTIGLAYMENGKASIIASVEPVVATLLGVFLFDERMTVTGVLGTLLVLGAIVMCNLKRFEPKQDIYERNKEEIVTS